MSPARPDLLADLNTPGIALLAVSGGADSTFLLRLAVAQVGALGAFGRRFAVATVDHGLRPESAGEAGWVARLASRFGLAHAVLCWRDPNPAGNLSAAARDARYALLADHARRIGADCVLAAHHEDDQFETHLMAAARGEGPHRRAAMRRRRALAPGLALRRPLLSLPRAEIEATLRELGQDWIDDPTNRDTRFARARFRAVVKGWSESEREAVRQRIEALQHQRDTFEAAIGQMLAEALVAADGAVEIAREPFAAPGQAASEGALSRLLVAAGGAVHPPRASAVRRLSLRIADGKCFAATLSGCRIEALDDRLSLVREFGRAGPPPVPVHGEGATAFDRRFEVLGSQGPLPTGARLVALGSLGLGSRRASSLPVLVDAEGRALAAHPSAAARLGPGIPELACRETVRWRLMRDLPQRARRHVIDQIAANPREPVGKEITADYLEQDMRSDEPAKPHRDRLERAQFQDG